MRVEVYDRRVAFTTSRQRVERKEKKGRTRLWEKSQGNPALCPFIRRRGAPLGPGNIDLPYFWQTRMVERGRAGRR